MVEIKDNAPEETGMESTPLESPPNPPSTSTALHTPVDSSPIIQEPAKPMLDVHAPHEALHTWKGFFVHIAIIVVGLIIAVGLEQTVEFFHHRHQLFEARTALLNERQELRSALTRETRMWRWETAELQNNLQVLDFLRQHPSAAEAQLPGILYWSYFIAEYPSAAWNTAQQTGVAALMPRDEVNGTAVLYERFKFIDAEEVETWNAVAEAKQFQFLNQDLTSLSTLEVATEIARIETALTKHHQLGVELENLKRKFADFPDSVTHKELSEMYHDSSDSTDERLSAAQALTLQRMKSAGWPSTSFRASESAPSK